MELSPEERQKIYEEEKARIESEQKPDTEKQEPDNRPTTNLEPNVAGLLCYIGVWITGIIFLVLEQKNKTVRFHAIQSIIVFGVLAIANAILSQIPVVGWLFGIITGILTFILWIVLMVKAYQGELYKIPLAGDIAEKASGVDVPQGSEKKQDSQPPEASVPPPPKPDSIRQVSYRNEDYFRASRAGRVTSSSFAIVWSLVFLIFFNFFNEYIAYYHYQSGEWFRYPILTVDFNAWLPVITAILVFSIVGHIIIIIFDKYILRETTLLILNLFGIVAVVSLLSMFPFDFHNIPNTAVANILPVLATIILIGIAIGLGIATLVSFVKLIVSAATGTARY